MEGGFRLWNRVNIIKPYPLASITWKFVIGKWRRGKTLLFLFLRVDKMKNEFTFFYQPQCLPGKALYSSRILLQTANFLIEMVIFLLEDMILFQKFLMFNMKLTEMK